MNKRIVRLLGAGLAGAGLVLGASAGLAAAQYVPYATAYTNEAWKVTRDWDQRTPEAGIAWAANSGLNWQEKFSAWVQSMKKVPRYGGEGGMTFEMTTPYGKTLPAPVADCADTSMILRITFASWYGLPVVIRAGNYFFGHFGIRNASTGAHAALCTSCDYSAYGTRAFGSYAWPKHARLRAMSVGQGDDQPAIGGGKSGAYFDELFLNKRAGILLATLLLNAGSGNLAGDQNGYNIKPSAIRAGDILLERWQADGIGHTIVIKQVTQAPQNKVKVEIVAGWLPPRQSLWESSVEAHGALSGEYFGSGECAESGPNGTCAKTYANYGGGLKRWRAPKVLSVTGRTGKWWVPSVLDADKATGSYIPGTDFATLGARTTVFEDFVYLPPPEELRDELVRLIEDKRSKLRGKPSGCSGREGREDLFNELYNLMYEEWSTSRTAVDQKYRRTEDYVFAPLDYTQSSTCCWNGSTAAMGTFVVGKAVADAKAHASACAAPAVFKKTNGTYAPYQGAQPANVQWVPYANDEHCAQGASVNDVLKSWTVTPFCQAQPWKND